MPETEIVQEFWLLMAPDFVREWPQSRERIRGAAHCRRAGQYHVPGRALARADFPVLVDVAEGLGFERDALEPQAAVLGSLVAEAVP